MLIEDDAQGQRYDELRQRAEALLAGRQLGFQTRSSDQAGELAYELQLHQVEVEMLIEELRHTEEKLAEVQDRFDYAPVACVTTDADGTIVEANLTAADLFGVGRRDLVGARLSDFVARDDLDTFYLHHRAVRRSGYRRSCEITMVKADGRRFTAWFDTTIAPGGSGAFDHCRSAIADGTERTRALEARAELRHRQALQVLIGGIAHDFNNLLTAVMGAHSLATMDRDAPDRLPTHLGVMGEGLEAIRDLVHQLVTLGLPRCSPKTVTSLYPLVEAACDLALSGGDVQCDYGLSAGAWPVVANGRDISRAIQNLVTNAREAMPGGGVLRITADNVVVLAGEIPELQPGHYVRLSVADAGVGIPETDVRRIFDPYFSTKQRSGHRGMGLGLAICYAIVAEHGGAITADSEVGTGTTMHLYLPAAKEPLPARRQQPEGTEDLAGEGRILVMDDQEAVRTAACGLLARLGYTPVPARDGAEAVRLYRQAMRSGERFAAVILDLTVPEGMGARATIKKLLAIDPAATVLISSGYAHDPAVTDYARHGFRGALPKPYTLAELGKALHAAVHGE
ncbi:MAG TPA: ATP-binding protein [bacterium]|jgi:PAS domain S-box-containing protein